MLLSNNLIHATLFLPQRTKGPCTGFPKGFAVLQRPAWADLQHRLLLFPSSSQTTTHDTPLLTNSSLYTKTFEPGRNAKHEPNNMLSFPAYLPLLWYLHSVPPLTHSIYIILYCSAGKGFSIICNYFLIWPI